MAARHGHGDRLFHSCTIRLADPGLVKNCNETGVGLMAFNQGFSDSE
jgi:hypothetical protein